MPAAVTSPGPATVVEAAVVVPLAVVVVPCEPLALLPQAATTRMVPAASTAMALRRWCMVGAPGDEGGGGQVDGSGEPGAGVPAQRHPFGDGHEGDAEGAEEGGGEHVGPQRDDVAAI